MIQWYNDFKDKEWKPPEIPLKEIKFSENAVSPDEFPSDLDEPEPLPKSSKTTFLFFQITCSLVLAVIFILLNTFQPDAYDSVQRHLKSAMAVQVDFKEKGESAIGAFKELIEQVTSPPAQTSSLAP